MLHKYLSGGSLYNSDINNQSSNILSKKIKLPFNNYIVPLTLDIINMNG